jgi:hypothetical protein
MLHVFEPLAAVVDATLEVVVAVVEVAATVVPLLDTFEEETDAPLDEAGPVDVAGWLEAPPVAWLDECVVPPSPRSSVPAVLPPHAATAKTPETTKTEQSERWMSMAIAYHRVFARAHQTSVMMACSGEGVPSHCIIPTVSES